MNYIRKLMGGAIVGATVSGLVSMNRKAINRLFHVRQRQRRISELQAWYESEHDAIKQFSEAESVRLIEDWRDYLVSQMKDWGYSEAATNGSLAEFGISARRALYLRLKARATIAYGNRLSELDESLADRQQQIAKIALSKAEDVYTSMRSTNLAIEALLTDLQTRRRA